MLLYTMDPRPLLPKEHEALRHIRNRLVHGGQAPSVRELQERLGYQSPRSAALILSRLAALGFIRRRADGKLQLVRDLPDDAGHATTVMVPLVGTAPCGLPLLAEQNVEANIQVSTGLARPPHHYFLLRTMGDSMNRAGIASGDVVLVRQQSTADPGDRVVALIDGEATIKRLRLSPDAVVLEPVSDNPDHKPIIVSTDFLVQGVVVSSIPLEEGSSHGRHTQ